ncbi:AGAP013331-PA-like protein [Anopheles sinensis]|uniref:AGAP013331-PA-like protein n=1 Tax=Anopheles sinensis TaxID=74873 RepID=A0A084W7U0_ANOSI|nr:AGAP013331-PA-like protein [Anopheles sinensis]
MPSVETSAEYSKSSESSAECVGQNGTASGDSTSNDLSDPNQQQKPADGSAESDLSQIEQPAVREFTQNDTINKFLLNSFLQRINNATTADECREANDESFGDELNQDFES